MIDTAEGVHELSPEAARLRYPVKLTGVVTYCDTAWRTLFIQDASGGVYVDPGTNSFSLRVGQRVEVTGLTDPGGYMPMVVQPQIKVLGEGVMPSPRPVFMAQGKIGDYDCEWVELRGTVQSAAVRDNHSLFRIETGEGVFHCLLPLLADRAWSTNLIGAVVRVRGVCTVSLNEARLFAGLGINAPDESQITVLQKPPADLFGLPTLPIREVLGTLPSRMGSGFIKVKGVVTLQRTGWGIFAQDSTAAIFVQTYQTNQLDRGDEVEVVGFQVLGDYTPILQQARIRFLRKASEPVPKVLLAEQVLEGLNNAQLIQIEARLLEKVAPSLAPELVLQAGPIIFTAGLESSGSSLALGSLQAGTVIKLTGICSIRAGEWRRPKSFRLLLRSPQDLEVIEAPPFLNRRRVLAFTTALVAAILASLGWVAALRRRVRLQTDQIRQRLEREAALEARYRELVENANDIIFSHDLEGHFLGINRAGERLLGFDRSEVFRKKISEIVVAEHLSRFEDLCRNAQSRGSIDPFEIDVLTKDKRRLTLELSTRLIPRGGNEYWAETIARDVTERKLAEERLRRSEAQLVKLSRAVEQSPAVIIVTDKIGNIEYVNPKFTQITGYSPPEVLGQNPRLLKSGEVSSGFYAEMWQAITAGEEWHGELQNRKKNGEEYRVSSLISPIKNESGEVTHFLAVQEDITEKHQLELQLWQAQKIESIGQLAAGVAHDFNNLLTIIQGHTALLRDKGHLPLSLADSVEEIERSSQRAADLTRQLLAFGRKQFCAPRCWTLTRWF